jgi:GNAT superfamily N-acetyltransferase
MKANLQQQETILLPEGFTERGATMDDLEPAIWLFNRWSQSVIRQDEISDVEGLRNEWRSPEFEPERDIRVIFSPSGQMVGYIEAWTTAKPPVHPWLWGRVDPDYEGLGLGTRLLQWAEERACLALDEISPELRFAPRVGIYRPAEKSRELFENMGYIYIRSSYTMRIEMDAPPPAPVWPEGICVRTFNPETDMEAAYKAEVESFRDHFGFVEEAYEEGLARFRHFQTGYEGFDPSLFFLAMDGGEVAGISLCRPRAYEDADLGWVGTLGVRRPWRKRGIGLALLRHSFGEFYRRGRRKVGLGVDAQNLTGALRLYETAGMHVHQAFDLFEKELRPGREISVQRLDNQA